MYLTVNRPIAVATAATDQNRSPRWIMRGLLRSAIFSATRRRAERARGLAATSAADGSTGLRVEVAQRGGALASARGGA